MAFAELAALLSGASFALSIPLAGITCAAHMGRWLRLALPILAVANLGVLALVFTANSAPPVEAISAIGFGVGLFGLSIHLSRRAHPEMCEWTEPAWWRSFEESFWAHVG